jgi:hypothetical protein
MIKRLPLLCLTLMVAAVVGCQRSTPSADRKREDKARKVEQLVRRLEKGSPRQRWFIHHKLKAMGKRMTPALLKMVAGSDPELQRGALRAMSSVRPEASKVLPVLQRLLAHGDPEVRLATVQVLQVLGSPARPALEHLKPLLKDTEDKVREAAASLVIKLHRGRALEWLKGNLLHDNPRVRVTAARWLGRLGVAARPALGSLLRAAKDPQLFVRQAACEALVQVGRDMPSVKDALMVALGDAVDLVRIAAIRGLGRILLGQAPGARDGPIIQAIGRALGDRQAGQASGAGHGRAGGSPRGSGSSHARIGGAGAGADRSTTCRPGNPGPGGGPGRLEIRCGLGCGRGPGLHGAVSARCLARPARGPGSPKVDGEGGRHHRPGADGRPCLVGPAGVEAGARGPTDPRPAAG